MKTLPGAITIVQGCVVGSSSKRLWPDIVHERVDEREWLQQKTANITCKSLGFHNLGHVQLQQTPKVAP